MAEHNPTKTELQRIPTDVKDCVIGCQPEDHERYRHADFIVWTYGMSLRPGERDLLLSGWEHGIHAMQDTAQS